MLDDVDRIIESHNALNHDGLGRRGLGHITRSGVVMLCAAWELYVEELLVETARVLCTRATSPDQLPEHVQREISKVVRESKHELKPLELAGDGWKMVYENHCIQTTQSINTPKSTILVPLFKRLSGVEDISESWTLGATALNEFVTVRGDIAHRGRDAGYIQINTLTTYRDQILRFVIDTDNGMADFIQGNSTGNSPWRRRTI
ncbi:HEPN domain-containing protein [Ferriphaselus amnicola]|nr:HEPN domain-containing protein [Ferriphaselus amnicola]